MLGLKLIYVSQRGHCFWDVCCSDVQYHSFVFFLKIIISVLFYRDGYGYYSDVYVNDYPFWTTDMGFLNLGKYGSANRSAHEMLLPLGLFLRIFD